MSYKTASQDEDVVASPFIMPRRGNTTNPRASTYYRQDPSLQETMDKHVKLGQSNDRTYVILPARKEICYQRQ